MEAIFVNVASLLSALHQQVRNQIAKLGFRKCFAHVGWHGGRCGGLAFFNRVALQNGFLCQTIDNADAISFQFLQQSAVSLAFLCDDSCRPERDIDIAIWREYVFQNAIKSTITDAIQIRPDLLTFTGNLMADEATLLKQFFARRRIAGSRIYRIPADDKELFDDGIFAGKILRQRFCALFNFVGTNGFKALLNGGSEE